MKNYIQLKWLTVLVVTPWDYNGDTVPLINGIQVLLVVQVRSSHSSAMHT